MSKYKVIVTPRSFGKTDETAVQMLEEAGCEVVRLEAGEVSLKEQLAEAVADADAVIAGLEVWDGELMDKAKKLKVISRYGVGYDAVDLAAAAERGILVTNTPGANGDAVADLAMALMMDGARSVSFMDRALRGGEQQRPQGVEMWQKTLGIIGTGRIGCGVARRCRGFEMKILGCDVYENPAFTKECGGTYVDLETLLREADFISIHSPLTPETENMISTPQFAMMKKDAVIVNTARGGIIDEEALYEALVSGRIRAAALDATVKEPPYGSPLLTLPNCILTPHAGAATREASDKMSRMAAANVVEVLTKGDCRFRVQ